MNQRIEDSNRVADLEMFQDARHILFFLWVEGDNELVSFVVLGHDAWADEVLSLDDLSKQTPVLAIDPRSLRVIWVHIPEISFVPSMLTRTVAEGREEIVVLEGLRLSSGCHDQGDLLGWF